MLLQANVAGSAIIAKGGRVPSPNSPFAADVIPIRPSVVGVVRVVQVVLPGDSHVETIVVLS